jgi:hypothetical protein
MNVRSLTLKALLILFLSLLLLDVPVMHAPLFAQDDITVTRDKDKTVYSIDGGDEARAQQQRDRDQAIDMLSHMPVVIDGRGNPPVPPRPVPVQPPQPTPVR